MNPSSTYYYFTGALSHKFCDEVIKYALQKKEVTGITGLMGRDRNVEDSPLSKKEVKELNKKRKSDVVWLDEPWIYKEVQPYIHKANKEANWNYEWDWTEPAQFTKYKLNQYYDWHCDSQDAPCKDKTKPHLYGKIRKLSVTCQLNDESEYSGGELEFDTRSYMPHDKKIIQCKNISSKGTIIVFPSFVWHRVKPVTSGTRYSLVIWNLGKPYR